MQNIAGKTGKPDRNYCHYIGVKLSALDMKAQVYCQLSEQHASIKYEIKGWLTWKSAKALEERGKLKLRACDIMHLFWRD